jgi:nucleoside-diphosphate-sugar epimerase
MNKILEIDAKEVINNIDINIFKDKKILITGASGLLGIHFISILKNSELDFECVLMIHSNPTKYFRKLIQWDNRFTYPQLDLSNYRAEELFPLTNIFSEHNYVKFDIILHLATYGQPLKFMENELTTIKLNTFTVMELFKVLKPDGKFLFLSTSELYSGLTNMRHKEDEIGTTTPQHFRSCYIEGKRCGEAICNTYYKQGYDVKIIRLCLAYGSGVKISDKRALNTFIYNGLTQGEIKLIDSGSAIRAYCYITDVMKMLINIMSAGKELVYNVGGHQPITIKQLAEMIGQQLNVPVIIPESNQELEGAPSQVTLSLDKYINEFPDTEFLDIKQGIARTIDWWKYLIKNK